MGLMASHQELGTQTLRFFSIELPQINVKMLLVKAMVFDRKRCFFGSLNLDPCAIELNIENGLYIESAVLPMESAREFDRMMAPENARRIFLNKKNNLRWESSEGAVSNQPGRNSGQRFSDFLFPLIPIEKQL